MYFFKVVKQTLILKLRRYIQKDGKIVIAFQKYISSICNAQDINAYLDINYN